MASCVIEDITDDAPEQQRGADPADSAPPAPGSGAPASGAPEDAAAAPAAGAEASETPPLTPPDGCERITPDGGVLKHVLKEGSGDHPCLHARCLAHLVGYLTSSGDVFMDTRGESDTQEPSVLIAGRDSSLRDVGLQLALMRMRAGERALVYIIDPEYGYGKKGSFSFPSVPPGAALVYDVTLLAWEPPGEELDRRSMLFEERLEAAERRRLEGNALFADGKMVEALGKYAMALSYTDEDFMLQLEGPHLDKAEAVIVPVHLNMAAAQLKLGDYATAVHNCTQVLARDRDNAKALFRRGRARAALGQTEAAVADLEAAAKLAPADKAVARELHALRQALKQERAVSAKVFQGAFGAPPKPVPGGGASAMYGRGGGAGGAGGGAAAGGGRGVVGVLLGALWAALAWLLAAARRLAAPRRRGPQQQQQQPAAAR